MNIIFFGTSDFAIPAFRELLNSPHKVLALITQPDRKKGRALKLSPPPAKVLAMTKGIPVYQTEDVSNRESLDYLKKIKADLYVIVSFGQILSKEALSIPELYAINLHGSYLPKYRGAAPTNWAIINGDSSSGVTVIKMNERMDEGDIILKKEVRIESEDTNIVLSEKLSEAGARVLLEAIGLIENGKAEFVKQNEKEATYAPKLRKEDALIDWNDDAARIHNKVRGFIPWPGAYTHFDGKILKIWKTEIVPPLPGNGAEVGAVSDIVKDKGIIVKAGNGFLAIQYLQREGKKILDAASFLRGHPIVKGSKFE